jgi:hypothetical protein
MSEYVQLEQSASFRQDVMQAGLEAPTVNVSMQLHTTLEGQGRALRLHEDSLLGGLREKRPAHAAQITLDALPEATTVLPRVALGWDNRRSPEVTIGVSAQPFDQKYQGAVDEQLSAAFWLGVCIGDAIYSGAADTFDEERRHKIVTIAAPMITVLMIAGNAVCFTALRHGGAPEIGESCVAFNAVAVSGIARFRHHLKRSTSIPYIARRLTPEARALGTRYAPVHLGYTGKETGLEG